MQPEVVENGHEANGNGIVVQKRPTVASTPSTVTRTRSSMSTMASSFSTIRSLAFQDIGDRLFKYGSPLEVSDSDVLDTFDTVEEALDAIAAERLRHMPHDGSMLDRIFKWATHVVGHINELSKAVEPFVPNAADTARMCWSNCLLLLQVCPPLVTYIKGFSHTSRSALINRPPCGNPSACSKNSSLSWPASSINPL